MRARFSLSRGAQVKRRGSSTASGIDDSYAEIGSHVSGHFTGPKWRIGGTSACGRDMSALSSGARACGMVIMRSGSLSNDALVGARTAVNCANTLLTVCSGHTVSHGGTSCRVGTKQHTAASAIAGSWEVEFSSLELAKSDALHRQRSSARSPNAPVLRPGRRQRQSHHQAFQCD